MPKAKTNHDHKLYEASLRLAATHGWEKLTLGQIAKAAKIPLTEIENRFADTHALLPLIVKQNNVDAFKAVGKSDPKAPPRDRLFEILMARFDVLQEHRKAILSIAAAARRDPRIALILVPAQIEGMKKAIQFAGIDSTNPCSYLTPLALWVIFLAALRVWKSDETLDMSRTMAALDRALGYANRIAILLRMNLI